MKLLVLTGARAAPGAVAALVLGTAVAAQEPPVVTLSADTVEMAEVFELRVSLEIPSGSAVYFPDTLPATQTLESHGEVDWSARRGPDGSATLTLSYPLIPFGEGFVQVPGLDVLAPPEVEGVEGSRIAGGSVVGPWADAPVSLRYTTRVPPREVWVNHVHSLDDLVQGVSPRPPGDVVGWSWSWPSVALILFFASVIGGAVVSTTRDWLSSRTAAVAEPPVPPAPGSARLAAVAEIDRLLAEGPYSAETSRRLFEASSGVVRGYAEGLHPEWGPDLTSTELMVRLDAHGQATPSLREEMRTAESVKFGRVRPDAPVSEAHLRALRAWLEDAPEIGP